MARPIKDNADYFSHDATMRDDPKIKALRRRFKVEGYGIWCMLLETITDSDNFRLYVNYEILAGDYDIDPDKLRQIINYCVDLQLLFFDSDNSILWSKTLDKRFEVLLSKRKRDRKVVIASENPQSKVKESKEKKKNTGDESPSRTLDDRKKEFYSLIKPFTNKYPKDMLREFYDYWTEHSPKGKKLRFEKETVFDVARRLGTWATRGDIEPLPEAKLPDYTYAIHDKEDMTTKAWEKTYEYRLKSDEQFRAFFGYELRNGVPVACNDRPAEGHIGASKSEVKIPLAQMR